MRRVLFLLPLAALALHGCTQEQISQTLGTISGPSKISTDEAVRGLKEALSTGFTKSADRASSVDGFFKNPLIKIPFPSEVTKVENTLRDLGFNKLVDDFVLSMNRGAEDAASKAGPIFLGAIKQMTFSDAWAILKGDKNAATNFLMRTTTDQLFAEFQPVIKQSLDKVNATKYFSDVIGTYNKLPTTFNKVNPNLDEYVTNKAIDGLFTLVAQEEEKIRQDPATRGTALLQRVFNPSNWPE